MKIKIQQMIWTFMEQYCTERQQENIWEQPIVKFADAKDAKFTELKTLVVPEHYLPNDYLKDAESVLSYFIPFKQKIPQSNLDGELSSEVWANAYLITNDMIVFINEHLRDTLREMGHEVSLPTDAGMISLEKPLSRWSQRHVAYIAGHGTFGINNMLISDCGCAGRYGSVVTTLQVEPDPIPTEERCLYKKDGSCGLCFKRCMTGALTPDGFDRFKCLEQCLKNDRVYPGADVCGKCMVELPCSYWSEGDL